jgi:hypothetical protein
MGDSKVIALTEPSDPELAVNGFECLNCGFKARTLYMKRVLAHHTCDRALCIANGIGTPCEESKTTPEEISSYAYKDILSQNNGL